MPVCDRCDMDPARTEANAAKELDLFYSSWPLD
jgi:hypothetical protein